MTDNKKGVYTGRTQIILYAVLVGAVATLWGYDYGTGNQIEQLPIVMRAMDSHFLTNDFFINASVSYGPRLYFARFVAALAGMLMLPAVYLILTMVSNILVALVSAAFARDLFDGSDAAALFAAGLVMGVKTFWLGGTNTLYNTFLEPSQLILPLMLASIWAGLRQKPFFCTVLAGISSLIHPLIGLEIGAIMLGVMLLQVFWQAIHTKEPGPGSRHLRWMAASLVIFGIYAAFSLVPYAREPRIEPRQFIQIMAYFRHPHHYLPSTFDAWQYVQAASFLLPVGLAYRDLRRESKGLQQVEMPLAVLGIVLVLLCLGGYLFVEVIPLRLWTTAQTFRLLNIVKRLGLVFLGGWLARYMFERPGVDWLTRLALWLGMMSPPTMSLAFAYHMAERCSCRIARLTGRTGRLILIALVAAVLVFYGVEPRIYVLYTVFTLMALGLLLWERRWLAAGVNLALTAAVVGVLLWGNRILPPSLQPLVEKPVFTLDGLETDKTDVAEFVRQHTPEDAVFLTSPKFGEFRYTARRAIVVDFKAFPFQDQAMAEWQQRLFDCYGRPISRGWDAEAEMTIEFRRIDDSKILYLRSLYGFTHAVLFNDTQTDFPVLYQGETYKVVQVSTPSAYKMQLTSQGPDA